MKLFSYIVAHDYGLAPNPFWGKLTLTVCKPAIRRTAEKGDWIIGTGSKNVVDRNNNKKDCSGELIYAMKIDTVLSMEEYDTYCKTEKSDMKYKRPHNHLFSKDWRHKLGDSIYDYSIRVNGIPALRTVIHQEEDKITDLGGLNALIAEEFYYLGCLSKKIEIENVSKILKTEQGHLVLADNIESDKILINDFLLWLDTTIKEKGEIGKPQMYWDIDSLISKKKKCHRLKKVFDLDE